MGEVGVLHPTLGCGKKFVFAVGAISAVAILTLDSWFAFGFAYWQLSGSSTSWPHFSIDVALGLVGPALVLVMWLLDREASPSERLLYVELVGIIAGLVLFVPIVVVGTWGGIF